MERQQSKVSSGIAVPKVRRVVVDANIAWRTLSRGRVDLIAFFDSVGGASGIALHAPIFLLVELFKHKERILRSSGLSNGELVAAFHALVARLEFHDEAAIPIGAWLEAHRLAAPTDENDTSYVALALFLDAEFWTEDAKLCAGLQSRGFNRFFRPESVIELE